MLFNSMEAKIQGVVETEVPALRALPCWYMVEVFGGHHGISHWVDVYGGRAGPVFELALLIF